MPNPLLYIAVRRHSVLILYHANDVSSTHKTPKLSLTFIRNFDQNHHLLDILTECAPTFRAGIIHNSSPTASLNQIYSNHNKTSPIPYNPRLLTNSAHKVEAKAFQKTRYGRELLFQMGYSVIARNYVDLWEINCIQETPTVTHPFVFPLGT